MRAIFEKATHRTAFARRRLCLDHPLSSLATDSYFLPVTRVSAEAPLRQGARPHGPAPALPGLRLRGSLSAQRFPGTPICLSVCLPLTVRSVRTGTLLPAVGLSTFPINTSWRRETEREREKKRKGERGTEASLQAAEGAARKEFSSTLAPLLTLSPQPAVAPPQWLPVVQSRWASSPSL